ncbi:hypothetical protein JTB14_014214 [Gonioctena quinquepunctata]|nr:hypothetical protein JTB14_014214 [Gonioctena quinquepunctata]
MFKLVVLFALVAVAVAKPSGWSVVDPVVGVVPGAVSHSYRSDVFSKPVVTAYAAPALVAAPVYQKIVAPVPAAVSHSYRSDVIEQPWVSTYSVPALHYAAHVPAIHAW